jgi:phosphatidylglycerophosphate synthase
VTVRLDRHTLRSVFTRLLADPVARLLARLGIDPNHVTVLGVILNIGVACLVVRGQLLVASAMLVFAGTFDLLDGALARIKGGGTSFGAILDSVCDRLSEALVFFGVLALALERGDNILAVLTFSGFAGSVLVSYIRARSEGLGVAGDVGLATRPERIVILAAGFVFDQLAITMAIIVALTFVTVLQRMLHAWKSLK